MWPDAETPEPGAVEETGTYLFELESCADAGAADLLIDDSRLEALRSSTSDGARWRWQPGFHAGTVKAELRVPGAPPRRFEIITDPDRRKLTRDDFDTMVREILEDTFSLFSLSSFRTSVARGSGSRPPAIARLEFLRSRIAELTEVVELITRQPRRRLMAEELAVPYHRASRATGPEILRSFRTGKIGRETATPSRLPPSLQGRLPEQIRVRQRRSTLDLPEHRQMAACLRSWSGWLSAAAGLLDRKAPGTDTGLRETAIAWSARCRRLSTRVSVLARAAPFAEAGEAPAQLALSSLFRNDPVYRRFYRLWQDMNLGIAAVFGDFLNLPLARTYELYELWCFLRLVRAGVETFGPESVETGNLFTTDAAGGMTLAVGSVMVSVGGGWLLCFQKKYEEFWEETDGRGSYSRIMVPDVVAVAPVTPDGTPGRLIVLDAKYRIDGSLNDALNSIHAYRDALVQESDAGKITGFVSAAYLMAPWHGDIASERAYRDVKMPGRLFHPAYRGTFRFGAVALRPGMTVTEISEALQTIIADAATAPMPAYDG